MPDKKKKHYQLKAVIDIGSTSIRMSVAQINTDKTFQMLESLHQSVSIGSDTFTHGHISRSTIEECVTVLRNFAAVLNEFRIDLHNAVRAVATSAVREALNRDEFLDRIYIATHINVEVIDGSEVNRLRYLAIHPLLETQSALSQDTLLITEVGGGSTEILALEDGRVCNALMYRMGSYRLRETIDASEASDIRKHALLKSEIDSSVRNCIESLQELKSNRSMLLMGGEARFAAQQLQGDWDKTSITELKVSELKRLAEKVLNLEHEQIVKNYHLAFEEALTLGPALQIYARMAKALKLRKIMVCNYSLRDGLIAETAVGTAWTNDFVEQILNSAREVGRHFQLNEAHADLVTEMAMILFDALQSEHQLRPRYKVILKVAAHLHDIGTFIGSSSHHKHSQYIIENSEIFGLGEDDLKIAALVARYHRRARPRRTHEDYTLFPREKRLIISKLSAILRVADALDRSHNQLIRKITIERNKKQLILQPEQIGEFTAEKRALASKGRMFEQVYGLTPTLRMRRK